MAKYLPGPIASAVSGSQGGTTFSHNRYGAYTRGRVIPTNPQSAAQMLARSQLAAQSTAWQALTAAQRLAWATWAQSNPIVDALGQSQVLQPNAAYIQINSRLQRAGIATISAPPVTTTPDALATLTATYDIGAGAFALAFTPTPIGATNSIWVRSVVTNSPAITFVANELRLTVISAANQATAYDTQVFVEAVWGPLQVGQTVHFYVHVFGRANGLLSAPRRISGTVVST